jgi:hypothetical protein
MPIQIIDKSLTRLIPLKISALSKLTNPRINAAPTAGLLKITTEITSPAMPINII